MNDASPTESGSGLGEALGAYVIWGLFPLYLILVRAVPPFEFVGWRIIWTVPLCLLIVMVRRQWGDLIGAIRSRAVMGWLMLSSILIGINWFVYIWAIQMGHVYAASLGYYINPLVNVLLGTLLLGERLSRRQWFAVALAAIGVALLLGGALTTMWISLSLAISFGCYGLVRKQIPVGALPGLTVESALLFLPSVAIIWRYAETQGSSFAVSPSLSLAIVFGGVATTVPLLLFAIAARKMAYSTLGFVQFLAPSMVFLLGLTVFGEELQPAQAACFLFIWSAAALFIWDLLARRGDTPPPKPAPPAD